MLVRTNNLPTNVPHVHIEGINVRSAEDSGHSQSLTMRDEEEDEENKEPHRLQQLKIRVYNHTVEFRKNLKLVVSPSSHRTAFYLFFLWHILFIRHI